MSGDRPTRAARRMLAADRRAEIWVGWKGLACLVVVVLVACARQWWWQ
ncbi:hypothetical protein NBM05_13985 [Rothia sp. AR01]|uniref:Uncharacterized protein n=1 Tax=Rothia santali TaxID=2949643 RepID=A0A9X2KJH5_9MICC|nr:hypothetical protein [Rothia santali]MCP3427090.1 hypothetical protein [Rothia santali]